MDLPDFAAVLGRVPSGIFILTARHGGRETGMLASWVMQAGFEPPMLTVAVNRKRYLVDWLASGGPFVMNLVGESQNQFLKHFGKGFEPDEPAFNGLSIERVNELPVLADAVGFLICTPTGHVDSGDHRVVLARIDSGRLLHDEPPMVHVRKNGLKY
jgi:flavin reductase (DIM6/NTAB) family NADH-FMN oxidoreductase RutF